jgi:hypothetical protein
MFARIRAMLAQFDNGEIDESTLSHRLMKHTLHDRLALCFRVD